MKCDICGADPMTANCNNANCDTGNQTQDDLYKHLTNPETLKRAAEGSMKKRQELSDRVERAEHELLKALDWQRSKDGWIFERNGEGLNVTSKFEGILDWRQRQVLAELKRMWNATQPDLVPEGWQPETEEGKYLQKRIKELKSS